MSKYRSPTSNELVGADDATLYLSANDVTPDRLLDTFVTWPLASAAASEFNPLIPASVAILFVGLICPATVLIFVTLFPTVVTFEDIDATVDISDAFGTNLTNV